MHVENFIFDVIETEKKSGSESATSQGPAGCRGRTQVDTPAVRFVRDVFNYYVKGQTNYVPAIVDATARTKFDTVNSGFIKTFDGSISWKASGTDLGQVPLRKRSKDAIRDKIVAFKKTLFHTFPATNELFAGSNKGAEKVCLPSFREVAVTARITKVRRNCTIKSHVDNQGRAGVEIRGYKPFIGGTRWTLEGSTNLSALDLKRNEAEVSLRRPFLWRDKMNICGMRYHRGAYNGRLNGLVAASSQGVMLTYQCPDQNINASLGVEQSRHRPKTMALESRIPTSLFGFGKRTESFMSLSKQIRRNWCRGVDSDTQLTVDARVPIASNGVDAPATLMRSMFSQLFNFNLHPNLAFRVRCAGSLAGFPAARLVSSVGQPRRCLLMGLELPSWALRGVHVTGLEAVAPQNRFFAGGPASRMFSFSLRGFGSDSVGGMPGVPRPFRRLIGHGDGSASTRGSSAVQRLCRLGGLLSGGASAELVLRDIPKLLGSESEGKWINTALNRHPLMREVLGPLQVFAFADAGTLKTTIDEKFSSAQDLHVSAGIGLRVALDSGMSLDATFAIPLAAPQSAERAPFQIGVSL